MRLSFRKLLILSFVSLSLVLILLIYLILHLISIQALRLTKVNEYETLVSTVSSYIDRVIEEKNRDADYLLSLISTQRGTKLTQERIVTFLNSVSDIRNVLIIDSSGVIVDVFPKRDDLVGIDISESQIFKNSQIMNFHGPYLTFIDDTSSYVISKRHDNRFILLFIEITGLNSIIERLNRLGYFAFIIDANGSVIFHFNEEVVNQGVNLSYMKPIRKALLNDVEELIQIDFEGEKYLMIARRISKTNYYFFVGQRKEDALSQLNTFIASLSYLLILLIILAVILSLVISNRFTVPIQRIVRAIEKVKGGDYKISAVKSNIAELQRISEELITMARTIEDREVKLRKIFETSLDAIIMTSVDGKILEFNEAAAKMFGFKSKSEVSEEKRLDSIYFWNAADRNLIRREILEKGSVKNLEITFKRVDGTPFYGLISSSAVKDESGKILFIVSSIKDITDKRKLQEQLFQSQKMESIGRLAGSIAHDFNNILSVIHSSNQLIQMVTKNDPKLERYTAAITGAVTKARDFIRKLLAFSKRQVFLPTVCDLNEVLTEEIKLLKPTVREDIALELTTSQKPLYVSLDRTHFTQVLLNLVVNAMDAMPVGGTIKIETGERKFEFSHNVENPTIKYGNFAEIKFSDTGVGIPDEIKDRIFEPFFTTKPDGTGLGLATVYSIVQQHGGFIDVSSQLGKGTTFKIYFPLATPKVDTQIEQADDYDLPLRKILMVEDNSELRAMIEEVLRKNGFEVISFSSGLEAIERFESIKDEIDLCLFDVVMPQIGGFELMKKLHSIKPDLKVIFMTGYSDNLQQIRSLIEEGHKLIYKPFGINELKRKILELSKEG